jgi:hypothetical protein
MNLANRYLNLQTNNTLLSRLGIDQSSQLNLTNYNECFINHLNNKENVNNFIQSHIKNYIDKNYSSINIIDADINYYIEKINLLVEKKFKNIINEICIKHIISMCDYFNKSSNTDINEYKYSRNEYYKILYENILCGRYKIFSKTEKKKLTVLIDEDWDKIKFENIINFSNTLGKIKFLGQDTGEYIDIFKNKFDNPDNLIKLINYVNNKLQYNIESKSTNEIEIEISDTSISDESYNYEKESTMSKSKYNFRFVIDNLKSNGYLLFEEFNKNIKNKYKKPQTIQTIKTDQRIIGYYIYLVSQKDSNTTNRKVNEILIRMKNFLEDFEESYYNNISYRKITVKQESEKYKSIDLSSYNRENSTFTIFKYSNQTQTSAKSNITKFNLNSQIEPYFDIYKSYYNSRYPDRELEFDPFQSTMIVKMGFGTKPYYIHLALIQYIVLDKLFNSGTNGLGIKEIAEKINIPIKNLQETINSLLHIKLIKRSTNACSVLDMKLFINYEFYYENNKLSISSSVQQKKKEISNDEDKIEFLNDRNTIVMSNMYDYIKKNKTFTLDTLYNVMSKNKIPFQIELEQVMAGIKVMLEKEDIIETIENEIKTYKYCE